MGFALIAIATPAPNLRPADRITDMGWKPSGDARAEGNAIAAHEGIRLGRLFPLLRVPTDEALGIATI